MSETIQPQLIREKILKLTAPRPGPSNTTPPDFTLSPVAPTGLATTGFTFKLTQLPGGVGAQGPFDITFWLRNPETGEYGSGETKSVGYNEQWLTFDNDAAEFYVEIGQDEEENPGGLFFNWCEQ